MILTGVTEITCTPNDQNTKAGGLGVRGQLSYRLQSKQEANLSYTKRLRGKGSANVPQSEYPLFTIKQGTEKNTRTYMSSPAGPMKSLCIGQETVFKYFHSLGQKRKLLRIKGKGDRLTSRLHGAMNRYGEAPRRHQPVFTILYIFTLTSKAMLTTIYPSNQ